MITLSAKALRFVDQAVSLHIVGVPAADRDAWARWQADRRHAFASRPAPGSEGGIAVPDRVASILLVAVERSVDALRDRFVREGDADGDIGNDIAFLGSVRSTLLGGLERRRA